MVDKEKKAREGLKKLEVSFFCCRSLLRLWRSSFAEDWPTIPSRAGLGILTPPVVKARVSPFRDTEPRVLCQHGNAWDTCVSLLL